MIMMPMRLEQLRQVDLNLLITFAALAEEKSITAAGIPPFLTQPAVSRALQRARAMFQDDLLVGRRMVSHSHCEVECSLLSSAGLSNVQRWSPVSPWIATAAGCC